MYVNSDDCSRARNCCNGVVRDEGAAAISADQTSIVILPATFLRKTKGGRRKSGDRLELLSPVLQHNTFPEKSNDLRRAFESVQHNGDAAIVLLVQMTQSFDTAAGQVLIPKCGRRRDAKVSAAFGGNLCISLMFVFSKIKLIKQGKGTVRAGDTDIHVSRCRKRSGCYIDHALFKNPWDEGGGNRFVKHAHTACGARV